MKNIFVGNLSFGTTENTVRSVFEAYGAVEGVTLITDRETGQSRGFAFVEMSNTDEADLAIADLHGTELEGRLLKVTEARLKSEQGVGRRGFRGDAFGNDGSRRYNNW